MFQNIGEQNVIKLAPVWKLKAFDIRQMKGSVVASRSFGCRGVPLDPGDGIANGDYGIDVLANFTASINAEMKLGQIAETITVTGESPLIDVQGTITNRAVTPDLICNDAAVANAWRKAGFETFAATVSGE